MRCLVEGVMRWRYALPLLAGAASFGMTNKECCLDMVFHVFTCSPGQRTDPTEQRTDKLLVYILKNIKISIFSSEQ